MSNGFQMLHQEGSAPTPCFIASACKIQFSHKIFVFKKNEKKYLKVVSYVIHVYYVDVRVMHLIFF